MADLLGQLNTANVSFFSSFLRRWHGAPSHAVGQNFNIYFIQGNLAARTRELRRLQNDVHAVGKRGGRGGGYGGFGSRGGRGDRGGGHGIAV